jgi:hypothetical protein
VGTTTTVTAAGMMTMVTMMITATMTIIMGITDIPVWR